MGEPVSAQVFLIYASMTFATTSRLSLSIMRLLFIKCSIRLDIKISGCLRDTRLLPENRDVINMIKGKGTAAILRQSAKPEGKIKGGTDVTP